MPAISQIPAASNLQAQLDALDRAIEALSRDGATLTNLVVMPGPDVDNPMLFQSSIGLALDPAISDPAVLQQFQAVLQTQAMTVKQKLVALGFTDDTGEVVRQGPVPRPAAPPAAHPVAPPTELPA